MQRARKNSKGEHSDMWDCSVCTYQNRAEAFKCAICDVRKGTSTRKPKVSAQIVAQQIAQQYLPPPAKISKGPGSLRKHEHRNESSHMFMSNIDLNSAHQMEVTVGDLTVIITDYKPLTNKSKTKQTIYSSSLTDTNGKLSPSENDSRLECLDASSPISS